MARTTGHGRAAARWVPARRWPWAVAAVVAGGAAGAAVAYAVRRVEGVDSPEAVDPQEVQAVVDRPDDAPPLRSA